MAWLKSLGCKNVVLCPGSRNAALIQAFEQEGFNSYSQFDERSAAYFALGMARCKNEWVAVCCTSGTAALNFIPAAAEAAAQRQKIVFITADRPFGEHLSYANQSIRQINAYKDYVSQSIDVDAKEQDFSKELPKEISLELPIHINVRYHEPFYDFTENGESVLLNKIKIDQFGSAFPSKFQNSIPSKASKYLLVAGFDSSILENAESLGNKIPVFADCFSSDYKYRNIPSLELYINLLDENHFPEILITSGTFLLSKKIRLWLMSGKLKQHWHIDNNQLYVSPFQSKEVLRIDSSSFKEVVKSINADLSYRDLFKGLEIEAARKMETYKAGNPLFTLLDTMVSQYNLTNFHCGNSMSARYGALFASTHHKISQLFANRGTAGIDGCISTFLGYCSANTQKHHLLVIGDVSFRYDFNAFGVEPLPKNFTILILNNKGGFIFEIVKGTEKLSQEAMGKMKTKRIHDFQSMAGLINIPYQKLEYPAANVISYGIIEITLDSKLEKEKYVQLFKN